MMEEARQLLQDHWGHTDFRGSQKDIIQHVLKGEHCMAVLPTGGGKSLCYQLPTLLLPGITLVVSPLIALMEDQVGQLKKKGIRAMNLSEARSQQELITAFDNILYGDYQFIYSSPEKLQSEIVLERLRTLPIDLIAIDEAHCISQWGHDFRPSYTKLNVLFELFPKAVRLALTATATLPVIRDIEEHLDLQQGKLFKSSAYRPNIEIQVIDTATAKDSLIEILKESQGCAIVYAGTRKKCHLIHQLLTRNKFSSSIYHGGLDQNQRSIALDKWLNGSSRIMVATNAFGMGIDKSDVRMVIHLNLPYSLENYQQEIGRAGRDGNPARAITLLDSQQIHEQKEFVEKQLVDASFCKVVYQKLANYFEIALGQYEETPFVFSITDFGRSYNLPIVQVYNALVHLEQEGVIQMTRNKNQKTHVKVLIDPNHRDMASLSKIDQSILIQLLRNYEGIRDHTVYINEPSLSRQLQLGESELQQCLISLDRLGMIRFSPAAATDKLLFLLPREDDYVYHLIRNGVQSRNKVKVEKALAVRKYMSHKLDCRWKLLLRYFNEEIGPCGNCDWCNSFNDSKKDHNEIMAAILEILSEREPMDLGVILLKIKAPREEIIKTIEIMVDSGDIRLTLHNKIERSL